MGSLQGTWCSPPEKAAALVDGVLGKTSGPFFVNFALSFEPVAFDAVIEAGVPAITFSWGANRDLIGRAHSKGVDVGIQIGSVQGAEAAVSMGADFILCQGIEAGGHVQSTTSLATMLPQVVESSKNVPVYAAGGLSTGDDIRWAISKGAAGVMLGTRFVATKESSAHPSYKNALVASSGSDTVYTVCFDGGWPLAPHRVLRNKTLDAWEAAGCPPAGKRPGEGDLVARYPTGKEARRYDFYEPRSSFGDVDIDDLCLYAGTGCGEIEDIPGAGELTNRLWESSQP